MTKQVPASWNEGPARQAVLDYVRAATTPRAGFAEPADRIATFDNDGTLWVEQPLPPQFDFVFREVRADPARAAQQPYKALVGRDQVFFEGVAKREPEAVARPLDAFARSWAGSSPRTPGGLRRTSWARRPPTPTPTPTPTAGSSAPASSWAA
ncbi:hypothetical protein ACFXPW_32160 [Streptomyces goshikiensis]|uniref:hypothetical protein n=1 Tax=Streptomyces goshikiensis TaxID=1942 RepID=UPI0036A313DE